jgi:hypothetical protein
MKDKHQKPVKINLGFEETVKRLTQVDKKKVDRKIKEIKNSKK